MTQKYDQVLLGILQDQGKIANFMDTLFNFLYRRTDFYVLMDADDQNAKLGFPKGMAESMVYENFKKYQLLAEEKQKNLPQKVAVDKTPKTNSKSVPKSDPKPTKKTPEQPKPKVEVEKKNDDDVVISGNVASSDRAYQADAECYNGAVRDSYTWSQTISDLDVRVFVPESVRKGRDVQVNIERKHLKVRVKSAESDDWNVLVDGDLTWEVNKEESLWTLSPGEHVHVNMEKVQERWWEAILQGEEEINVRKIDASRPVTDLGDEEQAKIEEMMYNENQKRLGKPQSHEQKVHEMLKQAWDKDGSPFKGQPFDPATVSVAQNNQFT